MKYSIKTAAGLLAMQSIIPKSNIGLLGSELEFEELIIKVRNQINTPDPIGEHHEIPVKKSHKKTTIFDRLEQSKRDKF